MKKILVAAALFCFTGSAVMAQTTGKTTAPKHEAVKAVKQKTKPAEATVAKTTTTARTGKTRTNQEITSTAGKVKTATAGTAPLKKDGTPDKRYKGNRKMKKDGTPDKRFKENQHH